MIIGHHLIWTAYGWWLPNDPRGSMSHEVRVEQIADLNEHYFGRKPVQPPFWMVKKTLAEAHDVLKHPALLMSPEDRDIIGAALGEVIRQHNYTCYESAVMPDHVHMLIRRHRDFAEMMLENLQHGSRNALIAAGHRAVTHPVWGGPGWKVFVDSVPRMRSVVDYIHRNPIKIGLPAQKWDYVVPYDGWSGGHYQRARNDKS